MKLKELFYLLGLRPRPVRHGFVVERHELSGDGSIDVARWLHPKAYPAVPVQHHVDQLRRFIRPGDVVLDIGAHTGDSTLPFALAAGPTGTVLAFEPNPYVYPVLEANAALNRDKTTIIPAPYAAMRVDGPVTFHYGERGHANGGYHEGASRWTHGSAYALEVEGRALLPYLEGQHPDLLDRLRYVKVDAEGFDLAVLETLEPLLRSRTPVVQAEVFTLRKSSLDYRRELLGFLERLGYRVHKYEAEGDLVGVPVTEENLAVWSSFDVLALPLTFGLSHVAAPEVRPG